MWFDTLLIHLHRPRVWPLAISSSLLKMSNTGEYKYAAKKMGIMQWHDCTAKENDRLHTNIKPMYVLRK